MFSKWCHTLNTSSATTASSTSIVTEPCIIFVVLFVVTFGTDSGQRVPRTTHTKRVRRNSIASSAAAAVDIAHSGSIQFVSTRYVCTHPDQSSRSSCLMIGSQTPQVVQQLQTQLFSALSHENEVLRQ